MTNKQIESAITAAGKCIEKDAKLEKKLELADWNGRPTARIQAAIDTNKAKTAELLGKLAREEMSGTDIDYTSVEGVAGCVACCVAEEIEEIKWEEGK